MEVSKSATQTHPVPEPMHTDGLCDVQQVSATSPAAGMETSGPKPSNHLNLQRQPCSRESPRGFLRLLTVVDATSWTSQGAPASCRNLCASNYSIAAHKFPVQTCALLDPWSKAGYVGQNMASSHRVVNRICSVTVPRELSASVRPKC
jgi:hypothetical protein